MTNDVRQVVERCRHGLKYRGCDRRPAAGKACRDYYSNPVSWCFKCAVSALLELLTAQPSEVERLTSELAAAKLELDETTQEFLHQNTFCAEQTLRAEKAEADLAKLYEQLRLQVEHSNRLAEQRAERNQEIERLKSELAAAKFAPLGDNHHNAAACPYCNPKLTAQPAPSGWQQRIAALLEQLRLLKPVGHDGDEESGQHYDDCQACAYNALKASIESLLEGQNAKDAIEAAFREGYDFGQADRRWDVTDAHGAWSKSGTRQPAKDAIGGES